MRLFVVGVFRECGGARCAHALVLEASCRGHALAMLQQLVMSASGDDDMTTLLALMHSAPTAALTLKLHVLQVPQTARPTGISNCTSYRYLKLHILQVPQTTRPTGTSNCMSYKNLKLHVLHVPSNSMSYRYLKLHVLHVPSNCTSYRYSNNRMATYSCHRSKGTLDQRNTFALWNAVLHAFL